MKQDVCGPVSQDGQIPVLNPANPVSFRDFSFHLILIVAIGFLVYSNTFSIPFQFDDEDFILENRLLRMTDVSPILSPAKAGDLELPANVRFSLRTRVVTYLTFWMNAQLGGFNVAGFHAANLAIHLLNALLVYFLVLLTFRTPYARASYISGRSKTIALLSALLFVSHPVQTEAVTYITQRFTSLVAVWYLLSLVSYIQWRLVRDNNDSRVSDNLWYVLSLFFALLAMKTKENAFTLPVVIALYELAFFRGSVKQRLYRLIPFSLAMLIIPVSLFDATQPLGEAIGKATRTQKTDRWEYFLTELRVIVSYLRLLVLPVNQNLDYDYPIAKTLLSWRTAVTFFPLAFSFLLSVYLLVRSETGRTLRFMAFGVVWFFVTISVESSVIPLYHVIYEHRLYLPSVGLIFSATAGIFVLAERMPEKAARGIRLFFFPVVIILFLAAAHSRNEVWTSDVSLWHDVVTKSPDKARARYNLGVAYSAKGKLDEASEHLQTAIRLKPDYAEAYNNLGALYISKGLIDNAVQNLEIALKLKPGFAMAENNLGIAYEVRGSLDEAVAHYKAAVSLDPKLAVAHYGLSVVYRSKGLHDKAQEHFRIAQELRKTWQ